MRRETTQVMRDLPEATRQAPRDAQSPTPTRGIPITLDRVRYLRYTLKTLRLIREEFGEKAFGDGVSGDSLAKVLWLGFVADDPTLTIDRVEDLIDLERLDEVLAAVKQAMGNKAEVKLVDPLAPPPATGTGEAQGPALV